MAWNGFCSTCALDSQYYGICLYSWRICFRCLFFGISTWSWLLLLVIFPASCHRNLFYFPVPVSSLALFFWPLILASCRILILEGVFSVHPAFRFSSSSSRWVSFGKRLSFSCLSFIPSSVFWSVFSRWSVYHTHRPYLFSWSLTFIYRGFHIWLRTSSPPLFFTFWLHSLSFVVLWVWTASWGQC